MGAAALPFVLGRLKRNHAITPGIGDPVQALPHIYTDTILHDARVLNFVVEMIGADRLMLGSDMPFPIGDTGADEDRRRGWLLESADRFDQWRVGGPAYSEFNDKTKDQRSKAMNKRPGEEVR